MHLRHMVGGLLCLLAGIAALHAQDANPAPVAPALASSGTVWAQYYSPDMRVYAANLRQAGAPESVVALLVSQAVNERFAAREAQLQPSIASARALRDEFSPERRDAWQQLRLEKNQMLREALGAVPEQTAARKWPPQLLARLGPAERDAVRHIADDYNSMIMRVIAAACGYFLEDDREKIRYLEAQRSADLARFLTADEILDYELLETGYGRTARSRLQLFGPTQEQLRTYLMLAKKHDYHLVTEDANYTRRRAAERALHAALAQAWGPETYARYRRSISVQFRQIHRLVQRLGLPADVAIEIFESQKKTTERGDEIFMRGNNEGKPVYDRERTAGFLTIYTPVEKYTTPEAKGSRDEIRALLTEHCEFVRTKLGDDGFKQYETIGRGWMNTMRSGGSARLDYSIE